MFIILKDDEVAVSIPTISPDFILKESLHLTKRTDQLVSGKKVKIFSLLKINIKFFSVFFYHDKYHTIREKRCFYYLILQE